MVVNDQYASDLSEFTVVVISLNRQRYLQRQVDFWSSTNAHLVIIDGSLSEAQLQIPANSQHRIRYINAPQPIEARFLLSTNLVTTNFVAVLPDDEFFIPSAIEGFIKRMISDLSIDAIMGRTVRFTHKAGVVLGAVQYKSFRNPVDEKVRGIDGVKNFWSGDGYVVNYPIYSIMRADVYKNLFSKVFSGRYENAYSYEIKLHLLFPYLYRSIVVDTLYWLRSNENDPVSINSFDRTKRFSSWFMDASKLAGREQFIDDVVNSLSADCLDQERELIYKEIEAILASYSNSDLAKVENNSISSIDKLSRFVRKFASAQIRSFVISCLPKRALMRHGYELEKIEDVVEKMEKNSVLVDHGQINLIRQMITTFHKSR